MSDDLVQQMIEEIDRLETTIAELLVEEESRRLHLNEISVKRIDCAKRMNALQTALNTMGVKREETL